MNIEIVCPPAVNGWTPSEFDANIVYSAPRPVTEIVLRDCLIQGSLAEHTFDLAVSEEIFVQFVPPTNGTETFIVPSTAPLSGSDHFITTLLLTRTPVTIPAGPNPYLIDLANKWCAAITAGLRYDLSIVPNAGRYDTYSGEIHPDIVLTARIDGSGNVVINATTSTLNGTITYHDNVTNTTYRSSFSHPVPYNLILEIEHLISSNLMGFVVNRLSPVLSIPGNLDFYTSEVVPVVPVNSGVEFFHIDIQGLNSVFSTNGTSFGRTFSIPVKHTGNNTVYEPTHTQRITFDRPVNISNVLHIKTRDRAGNPIALTEPWVLHLRVEFVDVDKYSHHKRKFIYVSE